MPEPKPYHLTLDVERFTCFEKARFEFSPGINVFVGENGTGKTHILKLLYTLHRMQFENIDDFVVFEKVFNSSNPGKLIRDHGDVSWVNGSYGQSKWGSFLIRLVADEALDGLVDFFRRLEPSSEETLEEIREGYQSSKDRPYTFFWSLDTRWESAGRPVFIPTQDILGHFRRFVSLYDTYKIDFDSTYRDLATLLQAPEKREISAYQEEMLALIRKLVGGEFAFKGEGFVLDSGQGEHEAALIAEGHRKLGALALLIRNGMLEPGNTLFWDEPEANVNPTAMDELVTVLLTLARHGVQIFLSTHSYVILKELDLQATTEDGVRYFAFGKSEEGTQVQSTMDFTTLSPNPILDQYDSLFARDVQKSLQETAP